MQRNALRLICKRVVDMDLKQVGEFGLISLLIEGSVSDPGSVVVGIGDDTAVLLPTPRHLQLLTTDMLVEGVHFDLQTTTPWQLGYKAVAVSLSDVAAMGGSPKHAVVSLALPKATPIEFVVNLYQGMKEICHAFQVNIVGGDTVSSPHGLVINVAVMGEVEPAHLVRRTGAHPGDLVVVTGTLGNSGAGLALLQRGDWEKYEFAWPLVTAHLTPRPQVKAGQTIARLGATSMNDISDGLASELNEIASASGVGVRLVAADVPLADELIQSEAVLGKSPLEYALYGGEDFQLVFTIGSDKFSALKNADSGINFTAVGEVMDSRQGVLLVLEDGSSSVLEPKGYNHFR